MNKTALFFAGLSLLLLGILIGNGMENGSVRVGDLLSEPAYGQAIVGKDDTRTVTTASANGDAIYVWVHAKQEVIKYWIDKEELKMKIYKATGIPAGAKPAVK